MKVTSFTLSASDDIDRQECGESAPSKFSEADIQTGSTDSLFSKPPQSGMADEQSVAVISVNVSTYFWLAELGEVPVTASITASKLR